jgi:ATP-dependent Clp protease ATP-binding subunit ClpA
MIEKIVNRELDKISKAYTKENIFLGFDGDEIHKFCEKNYDPRTGARGLPGHLRSTLVPLIADMALGKKEEEKLTLSVVYDKKTCNLIVKEG